MRPSGKQSWLWAVLAVAVFFGVAWEAAPLEDARNRLQKLPASGFGFTSIDLPLHPAEKEILKDANVLRRKYIYKRQELVLTVIDGTRDRQAVHDPFYCIRGSGWQIVSQNSISVPGGEAKLVRVRKDQLEAEALIWFSNGVSRHPSATKYWWQTTLRRLSFGWSGQEPVLINLQSASAKAPNWREIIQNFPGLFEL